MPIDSGPAELGVLGMQFHPLFLGGERPKNHLEITPSVASIHHAPPDFSTLRLALRFDTFMLIFNAKLQLTIST